MEECEPTYPCHFFRRAWVEHEAELSCKGFRLLEEGGVQFFKLDFQIHTPIRSGGNLSNTQRANTLEVAQVITNLQYL